jgi:hypothetical protein
MQVMSRSWSLLRSALAVLAQEKRFVLYPLLGGLCVLLFSAAILGGGAWLMSTHPELEQVLTQLEQQEQAGAQLPWWAYLGGAALLWLFLLATSFIGNFFLTALVGGSLERLRGRDPSVADGFALARARIGAIFGYSLIAATVGLVLSLLRGRDGEGGITAVLASIGGLAWGVATFLVIPVLAARDVGPIAAIKESAALLRRTWGEQLSVSLGLGLIIGLPMFLLILVTIAGPIWAAATGQPILAVAIGVAGVTAVALLMLFSATLNAIVRSAVFIYAETGEVPAAFDTDLIQGAMKPRKQARGAI